MIYGNFVLRRYLKKKADVNIEPIYKKAKEIFSKEMMNTIFSSLDKISAEEFAKEYVHKAYKYSKTLSYSYNQLFDDLNEIFYDWIDESYHEEKPNSWGEYEDIEDKYKEIVWIEDRRYEFDISQIEGKFIAGFFFTGEGSNMDPEVLFSDTKILDVEYKRLMKKFFNIDTSLGFISTDFNEVLYIEYKPKLHI